MTNHIQHAEIIDSLRSIDKTLDKMLAVAQTISGAVALFEEDEEGPITRQEWRRMSADERSTEKPAPVAEPELCCPLCGWKLDVRDDEDDLTGKWGAHCFQACNFTDITLYATDEPEARRLFAKILGGGK